MRQVILGLAIIGTAMATVDEEANMAEFMQYISHHGKSYGSMNEFKARMARYNKADRFIKLHQANATRSYEVGHNKFSDWTEAEYKGMLGFKRGKRDPARQMTEHEEVDATTIPSSVDHRQGYHPAVGPVKDQLHCGSCWAFATSAILEGAHAVATGQLLSFSEQYFVSCVKGQSDYGYISESMPCCHGCNGGDYDASFQWLQTNDTYLILEANYRYQMVNGTCEQASKGMTRIKLQSYADVPANNPQAMKVAIARQPVGVGLDAGEAPFQSYKNGIIDSTACFKASNHAVTAIGYGTRASDGMQYWIVKNSWGYDWGENGYVRIQNTNQNDIGICGINESPSYATTINEVSSPAE